MKNKQFKKIQSKIRIDRQHRYP